MLYSVDMYMYWFFLSMSTKRIFRLMSLLRHIRQNGKTEQMIKSVFEKKTKTKTNQKNPLFDWSVAKVSYNE